MGHLILDFYLQSKVINTSIIVDTNSLCTNIHNIHDDAALYTCVVEYLHMYHELRI